MSSVRVRHLRSRGLWIAALVVVQLLGFASGAVAQEAATITGRVTNEAGAGISGVHVRALGLVFYNIQGSAVTDPDGYYVMDELAATATNSIVTFDPAASNAANDTDYVQEIYSNAPAALQATLVSPGASAIDAVLTEGASIAGTVYASDGRTTLGGVTVTWGTWMLLTTSVVSGADGSYCIRGALPSTDLLGTSVAAYNAANDKDYLNASFTLAPAAGQDVTGADLVLGQGGRIEGTVTGGGAPLEGIDVRAADANQWWVSYSGCTVGDGTYVLRGVAPGESYWVSFSPSSYNITNDTGFLGETYADIMVTLVSVIADGSTTGIDADLAEGGTVSGTVFGPDGTTGLAGIYVTAAMSSARDVTDEYGRYTLKGLSGSARVRFDPSAYNAANGRNYLVQYYKGAADFGAATSVPVTIGEDTPGIDATMREAAPTVGSITGTVYGPDGPLGGVLVLAVGAGVPTYTLNDGTYELTDLAPGDHWVWFDTTAYNEANDPDLRSESYPVPVRVTAGMVSSGVDATLEGAPVDSTPPAVPTNVSASQTTAGEITVTWRASEDYLGSVDHYVVYISCGMNEPSMIDVAPVDGQDQSYTLSGLEAGDHTVWITAVDAAGNESAPSESVLVALDMQAPSTGIQVSSEPGNGGWYLTEPLVTLTMDEEGTIYYTWGDGTVMTAACPVSFAAPQGENTLTYWSVDVAGNTDVPRTMEFKVDTVAPAAPADLVATASGETTIDLSWAPVADDASGIGGYIILMDGAFLAEVSDTAYQATGLTRDTYHEFIVFALDAAGNMGTQSAVAGATTFRNPGSARRRYPEHPEHP